MAQIDIVRAICLIVLFVAIVAPAEMIGTLGLGRMEVQWALAVAVVLILLMYDAIVGFILGVVLVALYFRYNMGVLGMSISFGTDTKFYGAGMNGLVGKYITPAHLDSAQNNVVDKKAAATEYKGIRGVYGEPVYGAQGQDVGMPGFAPAIGGAPTLPEGAASVAAAHY